MSKYIELFIVPGFRLGIEDYEDGQPVEEHFMGHRKYDHRYRCWSNGCGIGQFDTIEEARQELVDYVNKRLNQERLMIQARQTEIASTIERLKEPSHLFRFEHKDE